MVLYGSRRSKPEFSIVFILDFYTALFGSSDLWYVLKMSLMTLTINNYQCYIYAVSLSLTSYTLLLYYSNVAQIRDFFTTV